MKQNCVEVKFEIINNGEFLENCLFSVSMEKSNSRKFYTEENILRELNSNYTMEEFSIRNKEEFSLHSNYCYEFSFYIEFIETAPVKEVFTLDWHFASKQNKKPYTGKVYLQVIPELSNKPLIETYEVQDIRFVGREETIVPMPFDENE